ncbi:ligase-associated DNA damage response endonuclease PdeM [bacterium]|nr:MAG: ligase-associated DNA damage response endonuclease PdeM [bacterium]
MPTLDIRGELLEPRPDRLLLWPSERTAFVADVHLGKSASFRALGVPIPSGSTAETLRRLSESVRGFQRLVILGDLWHAKTGRSSENEAAWHDWLETHADTEVWLVEGNHDLRSGDLSHPRIKIVEDGAALGPFALRHMPGDGDGYVLSGHLHPAVVIEGRGDRHRLPCFWFRKDHAVLPAFGEFTGCATIRPTGGDVVHAVAGDRIVRVR